MKKKLTLLVVLALAITTILTFGLVGASAQAGYSVKLYVDNKAVTEVSANSSTVYVFTWDLLDSNDSPVAGFASADGTVTDVYFVIEKTNTTVTKDSKDLDTWLLNSASADAGDYYIYAYKSYADFKADPVNNALTGTGSGYTFTFKRNASSCGSNSNVTTYVIMGVLVVAVIGFCVWNMISNKKKQKKQAETVSKIMVGDKVKTIGGICGFITELNDADNTFTMVTEGTNGTKCEIKLDKAAIYQTAPVAPRPTTPAPEAGKTVEPAKTDAPVEEAPKAEEKVEEKAEKKPAKKSTKKATKKDPEDKE